MEPITRRNFMARVSTLSAAAALWGGEQANAESSNSWAGGEIQNHSFRLSLAPREGLRNTRLVHTASGLRMADGDYSYSFGRPEFQDNSISHGADGSLTVSLRGSTIEKRLEVLHEFYLPAEHPWIEERITLTNHGSSPLDLSCGRCGFVLPLSLSEGQATGEWGQFKLTAIPYRREPNGDGKQYADFSLGQLLTEQYSSELWTYETTVTPTYASEGWAWTDGK
ncbi:MAG TPA: hypothetical protein VMV34_07645, partial [Terriglobia bacterium]|nr:hypothetical protein [Terriglobia bacterium]